MNDGELNMAFSRQQINGSMTNNLYYNNFPVIVQCPSSSMAQSLAWRLEAQLPTLNMDAFSASLISLFRAIYGCREQEKLNYLIMNKLTF